MFEWIFFSENNFGLPVLNSEQFEEMVNFFQDKEERTESLVNFILSQPNQEVPRQITVDIKTVENKFKKGCKVDILREGTLSLNKYKVSMKHEDYSFDIKNCILITQLGHQHNDISDFFQRENRFECGGYNRISPAEVWRKQDKKSMTNLVNCIWRICAKNELKLGDYIAGTRLSSSVYMAAQFKVHVANAIYRFFEARNVIDFSMGWGDRLAGWFCANQGKNGNFYGCDPNEQVNEGYKEQIKFYTQWSSKDTDLRVNTFCSPAEDLDWSFVPDNSIDLVFTSPPYSDTERYAKGFDCEKNQSWFRYPSTDIWFEQFLATTIRKISPKVKRGGFIAINIIDPEKFKKRERICDKLYDLMNELKFTYTGFIGMRMKQRPKQWKKEEKETFMSAIMVEPIWIFQNEM